MTQTNEQWHFMSLMAEGGTTGREINESDRCGSHLSTSAKTLKKQGYHGHAKTRNDTLHNE